MTSNDRQSFETHFQSYNSGYWHYFIMLHEHKLSYLHPENWLAVCSSIFVCLVFFLSFQMMHWGCLNPWQGNLLLVTRVFDLKKIRENLKISIITKHLLWCWKLAVCRKTLSKEVPIGDLLLPCPLADNAKKQQHFLGSWVLYPYQVSSKSMKHFWRSQKIWKV